MNLSEEKLISEIQESQARIYKMLAEVDKLRAETRHEEKSTFKVIVEAYFYRRCHLVGRLCCLRSQVTVFQVDAAGFVPRGFFCACAVCGASRAGLRGRRRVDG